jgi:3-oxoacyl-[acyl-carrier-protein] synthase II
VHVVLQEELAYGDDGARCCPFDRDRRGAVLGEGAGAVVLEDMERAIGRGATIAGEVIGYGSSIVRDVDGVAYLDRAIARAAAQALHTSRLTADDIGHVHAHGLATRRSDLLEAQAIAEVFQTGRRPIPVLAAKSYLGNQGAGGGMIELASSILAMGRGQSFPVLGFETLDPQCPIHVVRDSTTDLGRSVLNINVTPQGQASCLVVRMVD